MKNSIKYSVVFFPMLILLVGGYFGMFQLEYIKLPSANIYLVMLSSLLIFSLGTVIIAPGLTKTAENFSARFLILTTLQMLSVLSVIAYLVYSEMFEAKKTGFHLLTLFVILLFIQSYLLIIFKKTKIS